MKTEPPAPTAFIFKLQGFTESLLTRRLKRRLKEKMKQQRRNVIVDWLFAILWAASVVLVINQYFFQNYRIPSESMEKSLLIGDMIFVDKLSFGPELLPGVAKLTSPIKPQRGQIIVFENPSYLSKGPVFTILQQFVYMATLTLVDIDLDELGQPRVHYLIKRAVAVGGDTVRVADGELSFRFQGDDEWIAERDFQKLSGFAYPLRRMVAADEYPAIHEAGRSLAELDMGLIEAAPALRYSPYDERALLASRYAELSAAYPHDQRFVSEDRKERSGWYIPEDRIFTLGDNRDNSKDARWFGAVSLDKVLGHALFKYWPLGRVGGIR